VSSEELGRAHSALSTQHRFSKNLLSAALSTALQKSPFSLWGARPASSVQKKVIYRAEILFGMASGSSSNQPITVLSESSVYPDFKAFHRPAPDVRLPSKKSHIEQNFYILKKNKRANRSEDCDCQCAFCSISLNKSNGAGLNFFDVRRAYKSDGAGLRQI
jgi:hypothetical protein